ncbi:MAG: hypothetical protein LQ340_003913 [Diploschistes diacapsis]|nr:MAG: hypothetical protein LQ340_003913 [Diploschistes diacapsis]
MSWGNNQDGWNTGSGDWDIPKKVEQDKPRDEAVEWGTGASKGMTTRFVSFTLV